MKIFSAIKSIFSSYSEPTFKIVSKISNDIEIRKYDKSIWFSTSFIEKDDTILNENKILSNLFDVLFQFIIKNNFSMTKPVIVIYKEIPSIGLEIEMMFFCSNLPDNLLYNSKLVRIVHKEEMQVAVIKFGGYPGIYDFIEKRTELIKRVGCKKYQNDCLVTASYGNYLFI
jgi:hypothetical protein